jgi:hypothetical protein
MSLGALRPIEQARSVPSCTHALCANRRVIVVCPKCMRRGSYWGQRLLDKHGDVRMTDLLAIIAADCLKLQERNKSDWCGVRYEQL